MDELIGTDRNLPVGWWELGLRFSRMLDGETAVYDVMAFHVEVSQSYGPSGHQILVALPLPSGRPPDPRWPRWQVEVPGLRRTAYKALSRVERPAGRRPGRARGSSPLTEPRTSAKGVSEANSEAAPAAPCFVEPAKQT
jgi:hypothetical protein